MLTNVFNNCLSAQRNYLLKNTSPLSLESMSRETRATRKNHFWSRANRASCYVAREAYAAPLSFQDDSSKNPADWIEIIALCYELRGRLKYIWAHFPVSIPVGSRKQPVHLTCVRIDVFFEPSVIKKNQCLWEAANRPFLYSLYCTGTS